jgi:Fe-S oxidoreductase
MNILLVYPQYPDTYWSFKHALRFISKKAAFPPLGLLTVSAMLPSEWNRKLVDMNVTSLSSEDIRWADYVFISAMLTQKDSVAKVINECVKHQTKIVAGGPLFTQDYMSYPQVDHFILNEAELTLPPFLKDMREGLSPKKIYNTSEYADMTSTPIPDYQLLSMKDYITMSIQVSRGCPFACDFCEITTLLGHKVRMKSTSQVIAELDHLYRLSWRGFVLIVDDNFIGNKHEVKHNLLPAMRDWMQQHGYPFTFSIQVSINLADDEELLTLMRETGFTYTFIGIETPEEETLKDCNKLQNNNRDLLQSVSKIQKAGLEVSAGFIVGFDSDTPSIFQRQIDFIQKSGIISAMVGLLNAPKNTKLYKRLLSENRLINERPGNNTDFTTNFIPKMSYNELIEGYRTIVTSIYSVKPYYKRVRQYLLGFKRTNLRKEKFKLASLAAFVKSIFIIGIVKKGRTEFWKFLIWTLARRPKMFTDAMTFAVYGYHYRKVYGIS